MSGEKAFDPERCEACGSHDHEARNCETRDKNVPICQLCGRLDHKKATCSSNNTDSPRLHEFTPLFRKKWEEQNHANNVRVPTGTLTKTQKKNRVRNGKKRGQKEGEAATEPEEVSTTVQNENLPHGDSGSKGPKDGGVPEGSESKATTKLEKELTPEQKRAKSLREDLEAELKAAKESPKYAENFAVRPDDRHEAKPDRAVLANYFEVTIDENVDKPLYKYHVTIGQINGKEPKKSETRKAMIRSLMDSLQAIHGFAWVSDYKETIVTDFLFTPPQHLQDGVTSEHTHERDPPPPSIVGVPVYSKLENKGIIPIADLLAYTRQAGSLQLATEVLQIFNLVSWKYIHDLPRSNNNQLSIANLVMDDNTAVGTVGKKFYPPCPTNENTLDLNNPLTAPNQNSTLWFKIGTSGFDGRLGFFTSMRTGDGKVLLNVNTTTSVFFSEVLLSTWLLGCPWNQSSLVLQAREIKGLKVRDLTLGQQNVRVVRELRRQNGILEANLGDQRLNPNWKPVNMLMIKPFQPYRKVLSFDNNMVLKAQRRPDRNKRFIREIALEALGIGTHNNLMNRWSQENRFCFTKISGNLLECRARFLNTPSVIFNFQNGTPRRPEPIRSTGMMRGWDNMSKFFVRPAEYPKLHVIAIRPHDRDILQPGEFRAGLEALRHSLRSNGILVGMNAADIDVEEILIGDPHLNPGAVRLDTRQEVVQAMSNALQQLRGRQLPAQGKIKLVLVALPNAGQTLHSSVKWWGDVAVGIPTICALRGKFKHKGPKGGGGGYQKREGGGVGGGGGNQGGGGRRGRAQYDGGDDSGGDDSDGDDPDGRVGLRGGGDQYYPGNYSYGGGGYRRGGGHGRPGDGQFNRRPPGGGQNGGYGSGRQSEPESFKADPKILGNLSLKFNFKLKGTNHILQEKWGSRFDKTMVMGADVTHPGCDNPSPSLAGVVATFSTDPKYSSHYLASARVQRSCMEYIEDLKGMVQERVEYWYRYNGNRLPQDIIFYRDGVSESQFELVKDLEVMQIRQGYAAAAENLGLKGALPVNVTLLVVGKRHHTRFFYKDKDAKETENLPAGLVVSSGVVDPNQFSFYLQSHHSPLGTARSAHYFVVCNGMNLTATQLYEFTMNLCYTTSKCCMPLSICPPAKYADRLCERLRCYMRPALKPGPPHYNYLHPETGNWRQMVATYRTDVNSNIWASANNSNGSDNPGTRRNPWSPNLDNIMFYL